MNPREVKILKQRRADLRAEAKAVLDAAVATGRPLTTEETARDDEIAAELATIDEQVARYEQAVKDAPIEGARPKPGGRTFAQMFPDRARNAGGFESAEEFLRVLHSDRADSRLFAGNTGKFGADGGYSVPEQFFGTWLDDSLESEIVRPLADVRPMIASSVKAVAWDGGTHTSTLYGGFSGQWVDEGASITAETPKLRLITMRARKLAVLAACSNELIADGVSFEEQLGQAMTRALGWFLDSAFLTGSGAPGPLGVLNAPCTISVAPETGQAAATIVYDNIAKMYARLVPGSHRRAVWVINSAAIPQLLTLGMAVGTGGSHIPVLNERDGKFTILGLPVHFTEKVPTLGTTGDIMLADFSQYLIGLRADFTLAKSGHVGFVTDESYYRGLIRVDGQPKLGAAITPYAGSTVSPFIKLDTRS